MWSLTSPHAWLVENQRTVRVFQRGEAAILIAIVESVGR
jgi:hypothetical protein